MRFPSTDRLNCCFVEELVPRSLQHLYFCNIAISPDAHCQPDHAFLAKKWPQGSRVLRDESSLRKLWLRFVSTDRFQASRKTADCNIAVLPHAVCVLGHSPEPFVTLHWDMSVDADIRIGKKSLSKVATVSKVFLVLLQQRRLRLFYV